MFVQEEKIFAGNVLKIHICTMEGTEWLEEVTEDTTIEKLKEKCLKHCTHGSLEDPKTITHHKLIHAATERILTETKTVADENLKDKDCLLLIKKRAPPLHPKMADISAEEKKKQESKAPDKDAILKATANLSTRHSDRTVTQHNIRDFQTELRKILVSLIEVAQKLLALNPDAVELFKKANAMLDEDDEERVDENALQQLTEMGFPESRAVKALRLNHMSVTQAMEWLIEHVDDPTVDMPLPGQEAQGAAGSAAAASASAAAASGSAAAASGSTAAASGSAAAASGSPAAASASAASAASASAGPSPSGPALQAVTSSQSSSEEAKQDELTEIFKRIRRKREFRPDSRAVIALMEMGFDEKEVIDALRVNNNQQDAACEWLLGDRKPSPEDLDKGIDTNSPLFQAILENPVVQLGLTNPKTLLAFEDMLENPLNSTQWMNDPETGPVMLQISRIFQTLNRT
ncbi:ubiquitin-associated domain-containing protein 1 isoform X1 [Ictalurus furcatus]|uniref:ubiquitin-associated domain-containing protein 1 isoform X1 n=1 Tax=Ictalurus furcatus TaxID=66913 RepID=UPI00234FD600|nr:ubiquitin-associated domain-containing protein 1 isoform X1 [Ictalurus furcatus]